MSDVKRKIFTKHTHFGTHGRARCGAQEPGLRLATRACSVSCPTCYRFATRAGDEAPAIADVLVLARRLGASRVVQVLTDAFPSEARGWTRGQDAVNQRTAGSELSFREKRSSGSSSSSSSSPRGAA